MGQDKDYDFGALSSTRLPMAKPSEDIRLSLFEKG